MTDLVDQSIAELRANHDRLRTHVEGLSGDDLSAPSGAAADLLLAHYTETMAFMLGFIGKADRLDEPTRVALGDHTLAIADAVRLVQGASGDTATYVGPLEAAVRLLAGRLDPERTPSGVDVTGNVTLDALRRVFPGY